MNLCHYAVALSILGAAMYFDGCNRAAASGRRPGAL